MGNTWKSPGIRRGLERGNPEYSLLLGNDAVWLEISYFTAGLTESNDSFYNLTSPVG